MAHWDGDALAIDIVGYTGQFGFTFAAADENLHVTERLRRLDPDTLLYESTMDDPTAYVRSWTVVQTLRRTTDRVFEFACHEGNYGLLNILRGARDEERRTNR